MINNILWFAIRCIVTLAGVYSLQTIIQREGYRAEFSTLLLAAIVSIVIIRFWIPRNKE